MSQLINSPGPPCRAPNMLRWRFSTRPVSAAIPKPPAKVLAEPSSARVTRPLLRGCVLQCRPPQHCRARPGGAGRPPCPARPRSRPPRAASLSRPPLRAAPGGGRAWPGGGRPSCTRRRPTPPRSPGPRTTSSPWPPAPSWSSSTPSARPALAPAPSRRRQARPEPSDKAAFSLVQCKPKLAWSKPNVPCAGAPPAGDCHDVYDELASLKSELNTQRPEPTAQADKVPPVVRSVGWSPPGCCPSGGCLLAYVTDDHKASFQHLVRSSSGVSFGPVLICKSTLKNVSALQVQLCHQSGQRQNAWAPVADLTAEVQKVVDAAGWMVRGCVRIPEVARKTAGCGLEECRLNNVCGRRPHP